MLFPPCGGTKGVDSGTGGEGGATWGWCGEQGPEQAEATEK